MEIHIAGTIEEIAALVAATQERRFTGTDDAKSHADFISDALRHYSASVRKAFEQKYVQTHGG